MTAIVEIINAAGGAFVDFALPMLVQSCVLILVLVAVDLVLRKRVRAVFRYCIWMLVLVKLVLPPSAWSPVSVGTWLGDPLKAPADALFQLVEPRPAGPAGESRTMAADILSQGVPAFTAAPVSPVDNSYPQSPRPPERDNGWADPDSELLPGAAPVPSTGPALSWQGLVLLSWAAIGVALLLLLVQRAFFVRDLVADADDASAALQDELNRCRTQIGLRGEVTLKLSALAGSPAACGLVHPVILIPQNLAPRLAAHDLQAVLLHELAHIKRGDLWANLAQTLLQIVYFYNPLLWLANALIRRIREQAVDETVLVAMGEAAPQYPDTLINVAKLALARRPALSLRLLGVVESKSALTSRIQHILNRPFPKTARLGLLGLLVVSVFAAVLLPMAKGQWLLEPGNTVRAGEEADPSRSRFPDLALEASYRNLPGVFLREYRLARRVVEDAEGNLTGSRLVESHRAFEALSRMSDAFPLSLYAQRWVIILDWLAGGTDAVGAAERMRALAEAQSHVAESNLTRAYAAVILARDGHLDRAHDTFVGCSPSETPQWGWFAFEMNKYLNRRVEACAPNVDRMVDGKTVQTARTREQWQAIETELRVAQTAYADYLEYELLPLAAVAITSQKTRQYGELECLQIVDALRSLLVGQAHCFSLGATTHAIETRFQQQIAPKILAAWHHSLQLYDEERQGGETEGHVQEIKARWTQLNLPWDSLPAWWQRIQSDAHGAPSNTKAKWVESRRIPKAEAQGPVLTSKHMTLRERMPLKKLLAHPYQKKGDPVWIYVRTQGSSPWKPNLDEIYHDPDFNPCFFLIDGKEYACRHGFGPFDGGNEALDITDNLYVRPTDFHLPVGKHTVAYGWKNVDIVDPNEADKPVHFARLITDPAEFEVVEQIPQDYYRQMYEEGWEDTLRRNLETTFTDDWHKGLAGALLGLRIDGLPFDTAFAVYVQAEGSDRQYPGGEIALTAGTHHYRMACDFGVKELNWDTVGDKRWRIILRPSVEVAKKYPPIRAFYGREFVTDWVSFERSPQFEQNRQTEEKRKGGPPQYGGTIKADKPVDLDVLGRRWGGQGEAWPLPAGFELGWSPDNGGTLRIDPNSGVRLLWLPEANARLTRVMADTRRRLVELPQSRTTQIVPPQGEPTLTAVRSSEGKVYFVTVSKVNEIWANLRWWEDQEPSLPQAAAANRRVYLPDLETPDKNTILDLGTGELLSAEPMSRDPMHFDKLGKGDVAYEYVGGKSGLLCFRGARILTVSTPQFGDPQTREISQPDVQRPGFVAYFIDAPRRYLIKTADGKRYELNVISIDKGDSGGALVEFGKAGGPSTAISGSDKPVGDTLELRIAPRWYELERGVAAEYRKALAEGRTAPGDPYLWVPVRPNANTRPDLVGDVHGGKTWLLVHDDDPAIMVPAQGWRIAHIGRGLAPAPLGTPGRNRLHREGPWQRPGRGRQEDDPEQSLLELEGGLPLAAADAVVLRGTAGAHEVENVRPAVNAF